MISGPVIPGPMMLAGFPLWRLDKVLVLASGSRTRRDMLLAAGIPLEVEAADIDERLAEAGSSPDASPETVPATLAQHLAGAKALAVSSANPDRLVLGADQTLACEGRMLHKPETREDAVRQVSYLSGRTHQLHAAMAIARNGRIIASGVSVARLTMRPLSPGFIEAYVDATMPDILSSVGGYQIEGLGAHLFERTEGDHFTILGLPLQEVLKALRELEAVWH
jgi:septum formation protein